LFTSSSFPYLPLNPGRCTRDRRHACAPAQSGFCPALCRLTTRTTRPAKRFCSKTVIVNPLVVYTHTHTLSYGIRNETKILPKSGPDRQSAANNKNSTPTRTYTHTHTFNVWRTKGTHKFTKEILQNTDCPANGNKCRSSLRLLIFFITHSYFEQTRKKTLLSSNVWFLTHNKSRVIFIYPADNWLFIYIRVRRMDWSWLKVAWTKKRASTILRLIRFNCEARDLWLNCALQTLLPYWWNLFFFLINQKKKLTATTNVHSSDTPIFRSPLLFGII
jgi:hypothetical protein